MNDKNEMETKLNTWKLKSASCISCGDMLALRMTEQDNQEYFYCAKCYRKNVLEKGQDLVKIYNERLHI